MSIRCASAPTAACSASTTPQGSYTVDSSNHRQQPDNGGRHRTDANVDPGARLTEMAEVLAIEEDLDFRDALDRVMAHPQNRQLVAAYTGRGPAARTFAQQPAAPRDPLDREAAAAEIHNLAVTKFKPTNAAEYKQAVERVLRDPANAVVAQRWAT